MERFHASVLFGPNQASNLKELNYKLWQHCFFRREKSKVLTQLPDKVRQIVSCEITNHKEYMDAERDLIDYLKRYKEADDEKDSKVTERGSDGSYRYSERYYRTRKN